MDRATQIAAIGLATFAAVSLALFSSAVNARGVFDIPPPSAVNGSGVITKDLDLTGGYKICLEGSCTDTYIESSSNNQLNFYSNGTEYMRLTPTTLSLRNGVNILGTSGSHFLLLEGSAPSGTADYATLYTVDNGGKTELYAIFGTGAAQLLAAEP